MGFNIGVVDVNVVVVEVRKNIFQYFYLVNGFNDNVYWIGLVIIGVGILVYWNQAIVVYLFEVMVILVMDGNVLGFFGYYFYNGFFW